MSKQNKTNFHITLVLIIVISFVMAFFFYPFVPDNFISHWNAAGEANGTMPKEVGLFLIPVIGVALAILLVLIPKIDPLKKNIKEFINYYNLLILVILCFLIYIQGLITAANIGYEFNTLKWMAPAFGLLIFFIGMLLGKTKKNYFIGIRTPWTLADNATWEATHHLGEKMFKASGIIAIMGFAATEIAIWLVLLPVIFSAIYCSIYSYYYFSKK